MLLKSVITWVVCLIVPFSQEIGTEHSPWQTEPCNSWFKLFESKSARFSHIKRKYYCCWVLGGFLLSIFIVGTFLFRFLLYILSWGVLMYASGAIQLVKHHQICLMGDWVQNLSNAIQYLEDRTTPPILCEVFSDTAFWVHPKALIMAWLSGSPCWWICCTSSSCLWQAKWKEIENDLRIIHLTRTLVCPAIYTRI